MKRYRVGFGCTVIIFCLWLATGCHKHSSNKFPGYTISKSDSYLYDPGSLQDNGALLNGTLSIRALKMRIGGEYEMFQGTTDCHTQFLKSGIVVYDNEGREVQERPDEARSIGSEAADAVAFITDICQVARSKHAFIGDFSVPAAMQSLFGNFDPRSKVSLLDTGRRKLTPILDAKEADGRHLFVLSDNFEGNDCHACAPKLDVVLFSERSGMWFVDQVQQDVVEFGQFGEPPAIDLLSFAPDHLGFVLTVNSMYQGEESETSEFVAPVSGSFKVVLTLGMAGENSGNCPSPTPCYGFSTQYKMLTQTTNELKNIQVVKKGTKLDNSFSAVVSADETALYVFDGASYAESHK